MVSLDSDVVLGDGLQTAEVELLDVAVHAVLRRVFIQGRGHGDVHVVAVDLLSDDIRRCPLDFEVVVSRGEQLQTSSHWVDVILSGSGEVVRRPFSPISGGRSALDREAVGGSREKSFDGGADVVLADELALVPGAAEFLPGQLDLGGVGVVHSGAVAESVGGDDGLLGVRRQPGELDDGARGEDGCHLARRSQFRSSRPDFNRLGPRTRPLGGVGSDLESVEGARLQIGDVDS